MKNYKILQRIQWKKLPKNGMDNYEKWERIERLFLYFQSWQV